MANKGLSINYAAQLRGGGWVNSYARGYGGGGQKLPKIALGNLWMTLKGFFKKARPDMNNLILD